VPISCPEAAMIRKLLALGLTTGTLTVVGRPAIEGLNEGGQIVITANDMDVARIVLFQFKLDHGRYPEEAELTPVLRENIGGRTDPDQDRWGLKFRIDGKGDTPSLLSCGPDRVCMTSDDLRLWLERIPKGAEQLDLAALIRVNLLDRLVPPSDSGSQCLPGWPDGSGGQCS
jgi:hypothetical protein